MRKIHLALLAALTFVILLILFSSSPSAARPPNFIVIVSDDQRADSVEEAMPETFKEIFLGGASFNKAYVTTPACCPSRCSILTGLYAKNHGVFKNTLPLTQKTIVPSLKERGYYTGIVGKYLNSWDGSKRPEFDYWVTGRHGHIKYYNPKLSVQGVRKKVPGYATYILRDFVKEFLVTAAKKDAPFFLYFTPNAPHSPALPAPEDRAAMMEVKPYRPASYREKDRSDKPSWVQAIHLDEHTWQVNDRAHARQLTSLKALDRSLKEIISTASNLNLLENTYVIYISDNGVLWGEHGLIRKDVAYEPAIKVPFAIAGPGVIPGARSELVANIDIAPTVCVLSGANCSTKMDGSSLVPLLRNENASWRSHLFIEGWGIQSENKPKFTAVHTGKSILIRSGNNEEEFYKLSTDPLELTNRINNPAAAANILTLRQLLDSR